MGLYIFKPEILKEYGNRLGGKISMHIIDYWKFYKINTIEYIQRCEYFTRNKISKKQPQIKMKDIQLIIYDFEGVITNNKVIISEDSRELIKANRRLNKFAFLTQI